MKIIGLVLLIISISCTTFAEFTEARMSIQVFGGAQPSAPSADPCGCPVTTYMFCYTGDYAGDTDKACFENGSVTKDGTTAGSITLSSDYVLVESNNSYITWSVSNPNQFNTTTGTIFLSFYVVDDGDTDLEQVQIFEAYIDANNKLGCYTNGSGNYMTCVHTGSSTTQSINTANNSVLISTWYRLGYTWSATADGTGAKHSISLVEVGSATSWSEVEEGLKIWASNTDDITIGEKDLGASMVDDVRVKDVIVLVDYQGTDPF